MCIKCEKMAENICLSSPKSLPSFYLTLWLFVLTLSCCILEAQCFCYNTKARSVFSPRRKLNDHSYFGYSLVLRAGTEPELLVGAPRDVSDYSNHWNIRDPGALYTCYINQRVYNTECAQKILDTSANTASPYYGPTNNRYQHKKDNMWLGMAMDGGLYNNDSVTICAPRWINEYSESTYLGNGICYILPSTDPNYPESPAMILPLLDSNKQGYTKRVNGLSINEYYYGFGEAGMSVKLSKDGSSIIIGAPGVFTWTGTVIKYTMRKVKYRSTRINKHPIQNPYFTSQLRDFTYFGYSVDSGTFVSGRPTLYVAGAPRGEDYKGQVLVFDFANAEESSYEVISELLGHQMGEYFGAVVSAVDIDQDGLDDLLVGAPLYAQTLTADLGRVYVYINKDKGNFLEQYDIICGRCQTGARFGTSISALGDINEDGYTDVAIGAPYENNGNGAVYIYLGSAQGLNPSFVQRIEFGDMKGFGISISRGADIDYNSCNDIAIGAHESAKAVLLYCHASMNVAVTITPYPAEIALDATNFTLSTCFAFKGNTDSTLELQVTAEVDFEYNRARFENSEGASYKVKGFSNQEVCRTETILIQPNVTDFSRPIEVNIGHRLTRDPMEEREFCRGCIVLRPFDEKENKILVPFASGCGPDLLCTPDLKLHVEALTNLPYVIGSSHRLSVNISLINTAEPAYLSSVWFLVPPRTPLLRLPTLCKLQINKLQCDFSNPLTNATLGFVVVDLDTSQLNNMDSRIEFNVSSTSAGEELTPEDNNATFSVSLETTANISVYGGSSTDKYVYIDSSLPSVRKLRISHSYDIVNSGPTTFDRILMRFYIPISISDKLTLTDYNFISVYEPKASLNLGPLICKPLLGSFTIKNIGHDDAIDNSTWLTTAEGVMETTSSYIIEDFSSSDEPNTVVEVSPYLDFPLKENLEPSFMVKHLSMNCSDAGSTHNVSCLVVECSGNNLSPSGSGAQVTFDMVLETKGIDVFIEKENAILLTTYAVADISEANTLWRTFGSSSTLLLSTLKPDTSPPPWLLILSLILGILVLALISYGLYKIDFFKREVKDNLELLKNQEITNMDEIGDDDDV